MEFPGIDTAFSTLLEAQPQLRAAIEKTKAGQFAQCEILHGQKWFEIHLAPVQDAGADIPGILGISINTTSKKTAEEERALAYARERAAVAVSESKSAFLANMSHGN